MIRTKSKNKAMPDGPLESMFPVASSKILDFLSTYKEWDYSVSDIAKNSGVSFKTALSGIKKLESQDVVTQTRIIGNATMFQFNMKSTQAAYIDKLISAIASRRIDGQLQKKKTKMKN